MKTFILTIIIFFGFIYGINYLLKEENSSVQLIISEKISDIFLDQGIAPSDN